MDLPAHPVLRPGVRVTRRGDGFLQVGLSAPQAVVVPDSPDLRAALLRLEAGQRPDPGALDAVRLCRDLLEAGLLVDGDLLLSNLDQTAVHAAYGLQAGPVQERRAGYGLEIDAPTEVADLIQRWLPPGLGHTPAVSLLVSIAPRCRESVDPLMAAGRPHLLVEAREGLVELGPFVLPGQTACLRCVDAHRGEADPRRSLVLEQYATAPPRIDGVPEPVDPPVLAAALAWAVRDCLTFIDGFQPATWSRTVTFGPGMVTDQREWLRHPHCGCAWADLATG